MVVEPGVIDQVNRLETEMRTVLANLELLMHGTTASLDPTVVGGDDGGKPPTGELRPPHQQWRERWDRASEAGRPEILAAARRELVSWRKRAVERVSEESKEALEARIVEKCREGWTVEEVAQHCRCNPKLVRVSWLKASVIPDGERKPSKFQRARVKQLAGQKMSERDIAEMTKLSKTTIRRLLERAA